MQRFKLKGKVHSDTKTSRTWQYCERCMMQQQAVHISQNTRSAQPQSCFAWQIGVSVSCAQPQTPPKNHQIHPHPDLRKTEDSQCASYLAYIVYPLFLLRSVCSTFHIHTYHKCRLIVVMINPWQWWEAKLRRHLIFEHRHEDPRTFNAICWPPRHYVTPITTQTTIRHYTHLQLREVVKSK